LVAQFGKAASGFAQAGAYATRLNVPRVWAHRLNFEFDLAEKNPLRVNYRIWLQDGEMKKEDVERLSRQFCEPVEVTMK
jgi:hypothetical protein